MLMRPSFGTFESDTGRVYVKSAPLNGQRLQPRGVTVLRVVRVLRELVSRCWLSIGKTSADYALKLAQNEHLDCVFKLGRMTETLCDVLHECGLPSDESTVEAMINKECTSRPFVAKQCQPKTSESVGSTSGDTEDVPQSFFLPSTALANPVQYVSRVCLKSRFNPTHVHPKFLVDYLTLHVALSRAEQLISKRACGAVMDVHLDCKELVSTVKLLLQPHQSRLAHPISDVSLVQLVPASMRKLLAQGAKGCDASPLSVNWNVRFEPTKVKGTLRLEVGHGSHDDACIVFCFVCNAIMFFLDSNWPLPVGMSWEAARIRPPRRPRTKAKIQATDERIQSDETGAGGPN